MKILCPLSNYNSIQSLIKSGVDEFYLGFVDKQDSSLLNRRGHTGDVGNFTSFEELKRSVDKIKELHKKCYLTLNNHCYSLNFFKKIIKYATQFISIGGDGIICSDPLLIDELLNVCNTIILSTCAVCFNNKDVDFWKGKGVYHIVLSRDLSIPEMRLIVEANRDCKFEVFIMNSKCRNVENVCSIHHGVGGNFCQQLKKADREYLCSSINAKTIKSMDNCFFNDYYKIMACGICEIWNLLKMGVYSLKIVERTLDSKIICSQVELISNCIYIAKSCNTNEEYLNEIKRLYHTHCTYNNNTQCYYL